MEGSMRSPPTLFTANVKSQYSMFDCSTVQLGNTIDDSGVIADLGAGLLAG